MDSERQVNICKCSSEHSLGEPWYSDSAHRYENGQKNKGSEDTGFMFLPLQIIFYINFLNPPEHYMFSL